MQPIGLTFKREGWDKYTGKPKQGEIMLIHHCLKCGKISINRIAGDDSPTTILKVFENSLALSSGLKNSLKVEGIRMLTKNDRQEVQNQLFGKSSVDL
jgi:hypothetical protein